MKPQATSPTPGEGVVSFLVPLDDGGSPIRWYEYSVDGGPWLVVQSVANESGQVSFPLTGLVNGQSYAVAIRARNLLGVSESASAPLTVSVPTTTTITPPSTTTMPPPSAPTVKASTKPGKKAAAAPVVVEATGLTPGSTYRIELVTGQVLGTGVVGASGTISVTVKLPSNLGTGEHEIKTVVTPPTGLPITVIDPLFIDWSGSIAAEPDNAGYTARDPKRVLDTRTGSKLAANSTRTLEIGPGWNVDAGVRAVAVNVTATQSAGDGYVTVYPCDSDRPEASTLNLIAGSDVANMALVMAAPGDEICLYSTAATHLVVDLSGYFTTASGERMSGHGPTRVVDTRKAEPLGMGATLEVDVVGAGLAPETSSAVLLNVTSTRAGAAGYLTVFPCGGNAPEASNVNFEKDTDVANNVAVKVGERGSVCIFTSAPTDVIVDLEGSFGTGGDGDLMSMVPGRVVDTRRAESATAPISTGAKLAAGATYEVDFVGPGMAPARTQAAVLNVTVTSGLSAGHLTVFPCGDSMPEASSLNYRSGVSVANLVTVDVDSDGKVCFYTSASIDLVVDVSGFYVSNAI